MKPSIILTTHRFTYLFGELSKLSSLHESPVEKTCIIVYHTFNIIFDMTDGIHDGNPLGEAIGLHYRYLKEFAGKKYYYVKVNYSKTRSRDHDKLAAENNGRVLTCPGFSLYGAYDRIRSRRIDLREQRRKSGKPRGITFAGGITPLRCHSLYAGPEFKYPLSCRDASLLLKREINPDKEFTLHPTRLEEIQEFERRTDIAVEQHISIPVDQYIDVSLQSRATLQPNGVSLRHSIYENMCLGIPMVVFENSFLRDNDRKHIAVFGQQTTKKDIDVYLDNVSEDAIVEHWETTMTPQAILKYVFDQVDELR